MKCSDNLARAGAPWTARAVQPPPARHSGRRRAGPEENAEAPPRSHGEASPPRDRTYIFTRR